VKWLSVENNQLRTLSGVENLPQAQYVSFAKNPRLIDYSAAQNHPQLSALAAK
jgi:Leucine-rich repeat (LRR) protein